MNAQEGKASAAPTVSAIVVCFNEERNIADCLNSLRWCDEIVVVDSFSTDRTVEICRQYTNRVVQRKWSGYRDQKAFAHSLATKDWVLLVDSDERVSPELKNEIIDNLSSYNNIYTGFSLPRLVFYFRQRLDPTPLERQAPLGSPPEEAPAAEVSVVIDPALQRRRSRSFATGCSPSGASPSTRRSESDLNHVRRYALSSDWIPEGKGRLLDPASGAGHFSEVLADSASYTLETPGYFNLEKDPAPTPTRPSTGSSSWRCSSISRPTRCSRWPS